MELTPEKLFRAITKILENAEDLLADAKILKEHKSPRAFTLYHLAGEEMAKAAMVYGFLLFRNYNDPKEQKIFFRKFRDHKEKSKAALAEDYLIAKEILKKDPILQKEIIRFLIHEYENIDKVNDRKNLSLYTSILDEKDFYSPKELNTLKDIDFIESIILLRFKVIKVRMKLGVENFNEILKAKESIDHNQILEEEIEVLRNFLFDQI